MGGLKTLHLRMERHSSNALAIAQCSWGLKADGGRWVHRRSPGKIFPSEFSTWHLLFRGKAFSSRQIGDLDPW